MILSHRFSEPKSDSWGSFSRTRQCFDENPNSTNGNTFSIPWERFGGLASRPSFFTPRIGGANPHEKLALVDEDPSAHSDDATVKPVFLRSGYQRAKCISLFSTIVMLVSDVHSVVSTLTKECYCLLMLYQNMFLSTAKKNSF